MMESILINFGWLETMNEVTGSPMESLEMLILSIGDFVNRTKKIE